MVFNVGDVFCCHPCFRVGFFGSFLCGSESGDGGTLRDAEGVVCEL